MIGFIAALLINAVLFVAEQLLIPPPKFPDATPEDPAGPRSEEGGVIPVVFGTVRLAANVVFFGNTRAVEQKEKFKTGLFSSRNVTTGYSYEGMMQVLWCHGPVDAVEDIIFQDSKSLGESGAHTEYKPVVGIPGAPTVFKPVTVEGTYTNPDLPVLNGGQADAVVLDVQAPDIFGGTKHGGGLVGWIHWYFGNLNQNNNDTLRRELWDMSIEMYGQPFLPKYEGICHSVFGLNTLLVGVSNPELIARFNFGEFGNVPSLFAKVRRCPSHLGLSAAQTNLGGGANPAEIAYEVLTNTVWGMAVPASFISITSFAAAGVTLATEGLGMSMSLTSQQSGDTVLTEVMRYIDGQIQQHPVTGLLELSLNRADYVLADLPVIDESAGDNASLTRPSWSTLKNEVKVIYSVYIGGVLKQVPTQPVQDIAAQRNFGVVNAETISYPAITDPVVANKLAVRDLRKISTPLAQLKSLQVDRRAADFRVGRPFVFSSARFGIATHVFRVARVDYGTLTDGKIVVDAVEDIFALEQPFYANPVDFSLDPTTYGSLSVVKVTPIVTSDATTGYLELVLEGGGGRVTAVEFQTQSGKQEPSEWIENTSEDGFKAEVDLDPGWPSHIAWRVRGHLKDDTIGNLADGEVEYPLSTMSSLRFKNFRELRRTPTAVTYGWDALSTDVQEIWSWQKNSQQDVDPPLSPENNEDRLWPDIKTAKPDKFLTRETTTFTVDVPNFGFIQTWILQQVDKELMRGNPQSIKVLATPDIPRITNIETREGATGLFKDILSLNVVDPQARGGTLKAWLNHDGVADANPAGVEDGTIFIAITPHSVLVDDAFTVPGGTSQLFDNVRIHPGAGKRIYFEFINIKGTSSGKIQFILLSNGGIITPDGQLKDNSINLASQIAASMTMPSVYDTLPATGRTNEIAFDTSTSKLMRWTGTRWTAEVPAPDLTGILVGSQLSDGIIVDTKIAVGAVKTLHMVAGTIAGDRIAVNSLDAGRIVALSIGAGQLAADSIIAGKIAAAAVKATAIDAGAVTAIKIAVTLLSEVSANAGIIVAGKLQALSGGTTIDLNATGANPVISHPSFTIRADGSANFGGTVSASVFSSATLQLTSLDPTNGTILSLTSAGLTEGAMLYWTRAGTNTRLYSNGFSIGMRATSGAAIIEGVSAQVSATAGTAFVSGTAGVQLLALTDSVYLQMTGDSAPKRLSYAAANSGGSGKRYVLADN